MLPWTDLSPIPWIFIIKYNIFDGHNILKSLKASLMPRKTLFFPFSSSFLLFLFGTCNDTAKNSEMIYGWFSSTPKFPQCHIFNKKCWTSIQHVSTLIYNFRVKTLWNIPLHQQASHQVGIVLFFFFSKIISKSFE